MSPLPFQGSGRFKYFQIPSTNLTGLMQFLVFGLHYFQLLTSLEYVKCKLLSFLVYIPP